jgi:hypothetical protein
MELPYPILDVRLMTKAAAEAVDRVFFDRDSSTAKPRFSWLTFARKANTPTTFYFDLAAGCH